MTAGVPGLGLSGLFALLSALVLPALPRGSRRRRQVVPLFVLALVITAAVLGSWELISALVGTAGRDGKAVSISGQAGVPILVISLTLMCAVIGVAETLHLVVGLTPTPTPEAIPTACRRRDRVRLPQHRQWAIVARCDDLDAAVQRATQVRAMDVSDGRWRVVVAATGSSEVAVYARRVSAVA